MSTMTDFNYLEQIEKKLDIKLKKNVSLHKSARGYNIDAESRVTAINLYGCNLHHLNQIINSLSRLKNLTKLNIGNNTICDLSPLLCLKNLTELYISDNRVSDLSPLSSLKNLAILYISGNQVSELDSLSCLDNLTLLDISRNHVSDLHPLFNLKKLVKLHIAYNRVSELGSLSGLTNLKTLNILGNQVSKLGPLSGLTNLAELNGYGNQISDLGPLSDLKYLSTLNVCHNQVSDLSPLSSLIHLSLIDASHNIVSNIGELSALKKLKRFNLSCNPLKILPSWITDFAMEIQWKNHLKEQSRSGYITFFDNPLEIPTPEIVKQGKSAIRNYFKQLEEQGSNYLFEAKLLIVGEPGAGKTTMACKLDNPDCDLPNENNTTRGIDVKPTWFPIRQEDFPGFNEEKLDGKKLRMNIWDFGGQEIYKSTHRFFLSKRSLYALVVDNRREDEDFNYWLHVIEMFGDNSPLLIVQNEKQKRKRDIDIGALRLRFTNIKDIVPVDFAEIDKTRLFKLEQAIRYQIIALPHIGNPVPARWTSVRKILDEEQHQTISFPEYLALCTAQGITERKDALVLSQYFHDIGVFLHFQDDSLLKKTIFLKPNWATHAVYKLLDHPLLDIQHGRFSRKDSIVIWDKEEYEDLRDALLRLMQKFFLTYEIDGSGHYIVPEKLPSANPEYPWDSTGNLYLQYAYDLFMPKGITSQFIVEMHRYISNHDLVWKRGCLLERDGAIAEVIESYDARRITIRLSGKNKRDFMTIISEKVDDINNKYEKMKVDKLIPCNCSECIVSENPFFYTHADLKKRIEKGRRDVECGNSYELVNVRQLIDDVLSEKPIHHKSGRNVLSEKTKVFVSYAHKDDEYLKRLQTHIKAAKNIGIDIDGWDDNRINAGDRWRQEIEEALESAKVGVLLVSTDFLASDFIMNNELPALLKSAEKNGATILSLIIKPSLYKQSKLAMFQAINNPDENFADLSPSEQDKHYLKLIRRITELLQE